MEVIPHQEEGLVLALAQLRQPSGSKQHIVNVQLTSVQPNYWTVKLVDGSEVKQMYME